MRLLKRIEDFIFSLYAVILGDLRLSKYEEMEDRLDFIVINIKQDARWLCILPEVKPVLERHEQMVSDNWRSTSFDDITTFRDKVKRSIEAERLYQSIKK